MPRTRQTILNSKHPDLNSANLNANGRKLSNYTEGSLDVTRQEACNKCPLEIYTVQEGSSDHNPVLLLIGDPEAVPQDNSLKLKRTEWSRFRRMLNDNLLCKMLSIGPSSTEFNKEVKSKYHELLGSKN